MRTARKEELLRSFPVLPDELAEHMKKGKYAENFCVFLTNGHELFVRCYHRYSRGNSIVERQRYVFAKDGAVRYGLTYDGKEKRYIWTVRKEFREPVFFQTCYSYNFDNTYHVLNYDAIYKSDMKYSQLDKMETALLMCFLGLYCKHPNVEYLIKGNYGHLIKDGVTGYWGSKRYLAISDDINWKSNNLLHMLRLNRTEFKMLQGNEYMYGNYITFRREYPKLKPEELFMAVKVFGAERGTADFFAGVTGYSVARIAKYLDENNIENWHYRDYIKQCKKLKYDLHNTAICFPHDFNAMHTRLSMIIQHKEDERMKELFLANYDGRKDFEFAYKDLILIQPEKYSDIVNEGKALCHCVGGYADRHAKGLTNIFFIRKAGEPDKPYFTIEVSNDFRIRQCHGYRNDIKGKPLEIEEFEAEYQKYLEGLKNVRNHHQRAV